jgi:hypothetical protein
MPNVTTETSKNSTAGFEVIERNAIISSRKNSSVPDKRIHVTGDVARLHDGRTIARVAQADGDVMTFGYGPYDQTTRQASQIDPQAFKPASLFRATFEKGEIRDGWHRLSDAARISPKDAEFTAFAKANPYVAEHLGIKPSAGATPALFQCGTTQYTKRAIGPNEDGWRELRDRHRSGDFGLNGTHGATLTDEEWFTVGLLPIDRQNSAAVFAQRGAIRSRFQINGYVFDVLTILAGPSTRTLMYYVEN